MGDIFFVQKSDAKNHIQVAKNLIWGVILSSWAAEINLFHRKNETKKMDTFLRNISRLTQKKGFWKSRFSEQKWSQNHLSDSRKNVAFFLHKKVLKFYVIVF